MMYIRAGARKKFDFKSVPCVVLCTSDHKNYRLHDFNSCKFVIARNVVFDENKFPFKESRVNYDIPEAPQSSDTSVFVDLTDFSSLNDTYHLSYSDSPDRSDHDAQTGSDEGNANDFSTPERARRYLSLEHHALSRLTYRASVCHDKVSTAPPEKQCHGAVEDKDSPTLSRAMKSPNIEHWIETISEELESLNEAQTWEQSAMHLLENVFFLPSLF
jgi:hypothetical protein